MRVSPARCGSARLPNRAPARRQIDVDRSATADLASLSIVAAVMAAAYVLDLAGLPIIPYVLLFVAGAAAVTARVLLQPRFDAGFALVVAASFGYAMWIASPDWLPVTNGPDVVH